MSDWITWGTCPSCGSRAAIGWETVAACAGGPTDERPVELDCSCGCAITEHSQLATLQEQSPQRRNGAPVRSGADLGTRTGAPPWTRRRDPRPGSASTFDQQVG